MKNNLPTMEIILPIYNEEKTIPELLSQLDAVSEKLKGRVAVSYVFVNDGSNDRSKTLLRGLNQERPNVKVVELIHNFGHGAAVTCGLNHFSSDIAVVMDADLQDSPTVILEMFNAWEQGEKTVVAERGKRNEKTRFLFQAFYFILRRVAKIPSSVNFGSHCLMDRTVVENFLKFHEKNRYFPGLVSFSSGKVYGIKTERFSRAHGKSHAGFKGQLHYAIVALVSFSSTPVRFISGVGFFASLAAMLSGIFIVGIKILTPWAIPGWASIMVAVAFASGTQLLCLGIIGEYIARIYDEVKQRPLYLVDQVLETRQLSTKTDSPSATRIQSTSHLQAS